MAGRLAGGLRGGAGPAEAQKSADTLRIVWFDQIPDVDPVLQPAPHRAGASRTRPGTRWSIATRRRFIIKPLLASSWKFTDDTTLEFSCVHGVTFQDGSQFSADDVVYTVNSVLDRQESLRAQQFLVARSAPQDRRLRTCGIELKRVFPAALEYLAMVLPIWPKAYREKVGVQDATAQASHRHRAVSSITKVDGATEIDMERYDGYYADSPKGKPAISSLVIHEVPDSATAMAELLGSRADWIWNFIADHFDNRRAHAEPAGDARRIRCASNISAWMPPAAPGRTIR